MRARFSVQTLPDTAAFWTVTWAASRSAKGTSVLRMVDLPSHSATSTIPKPTSKRLAVVVGFCGAPHIQPTPRPTAMPKQNDPQPGFWVKTPPQPRLKITAPMIPRTVHRASGVNGSSLLCIKSR